MRPQVTVRTWLDDHEDFRMKVTDALSERTIDVKDLTWEPSNDQGRVRVEGYAYTAGGKRYWTTCETARFADLPQRVRDAFIDALAQAIPTTSKEN